MATRSFNLGNLVEWEPLAFGELLSFEVPKLGFRSVQLDVLVDRQATIWAVTADTNYIVGYGDGQVHCRFAVDADFAVFIEAAGEGSAWVKTGRDAQVIPQSDLPSHTTIEPRPSGPSEELRRMMHMVRLNSERRERVLRDEMARLSAQVAAQAPPAASAPPAPPAAPAAPLIEPEGE